MAEYNITANDLERMMRMAFFESGSIPVGDRVRDYQQVLGSMLTRGQLFANGMAGEGYGGLRSDQGRNTGWENTPIQRSLAAGNAYEPLGRFGNDLSRLPDVPQIYRELAAQYFQQVLTNPDTVNLHTDYGNPVVVAQRQGDNWRNHWLYEVSQNPDMVNGAGSVNQHAHGTMTGITLPRSFNPGFDGGAQDWINRNVSLDGFNTPDAIQRALEWAATPDMAYPAPGNDGFGTVPGAGPGDAFGLGDGGIGRGGSTNTVGYAPGFGTPGGGPGDFFGYGAGANGLGSAVPYGDVTPFAFAGGRGFSGGVGPGQFLPSLTPFGPAPGPYGFSGANPSAGVAPGQAGQLPAGFDPAAYLAANPDVRAAGSDPRQHYLQFGMEEGRPLGVPGLTPTQGAPAPTPTLGGGGGFAPPLDTAQPAPTLGRPDLVNILTGGGTPAPTSGPGAAAGTLGPGGTAATLPPGFNAQLYLQANPDVAVRGADPAQHWLSYGMQEGRPLAPSGLTPTQGTGPAAPTLGGGPAVPTLGPGDAAPTLGPDLSTTAWSPNGPSLSMAGGGGIGRGGGASFGGLPMLPAAAQPAPPAAGALPPNFDAQLYLRANPDVAQAGADPGQHYLRYGMQEGRPLAPSATTPTLNTAAPAPTLNTATPVPTQGPGPTVPTLGAGPEVPTQGPSGVEIAFDPNAYLDANPDVRASGMNPFQHFVLSGFNEGRNLNTSGQTFGSGSNNFLTFDLPSLTSGWDQGLRDTFTGGFGATGGSPGGNGVSNPFGFTSTSVGGFDVNAPGMGGPVRGFDGGVAYQNNPSIYLPSGAVRTRSSSEAFFRAQQASRDWMARAAVPAAAQNYNVNNQQLAQFGASNTIPNLTLTNYQAAVPRPNSTTGTIGLTGSLGTTWIF